MQSFDPTPRGVPSDQGVPPGVTRCAPVTITVLALLPSACASIETPARVPPHDNYTFHDVRTLGPFTVERWVAIGSPEISPAGTCECITVVYADRRRVLTLGEPGTMTAISIDAISGKDVNGDRLPDLVVSEWSGGAHCCYTTRIYSVGETPRALLALDTGNCGPGELADLDGDGVLEFLTCDDRWAYAHCSFAESPFPRVVFAYDAARGVYEVATPRYAARLRDEIAASTLEARNRMAAEGGRDAGRDKCTVLQPALNLIYVGRLEEGRRLIRDLYRGADLDAFEQEAVDGARASRLWIAAP